MCVTWGGGKLGAAYFDGETSVLFVMNDSSERDDFQLLLQRMSACIILFDAPGALQHFNHTFVFQLLSKLNPESLSQVVNKMTDFSSSSNI